MRGVDRENNFLPALKSNLWVVGNILLDSIGVLLRSNDIWLAVNEKTSFSAH